MTSQFVRQSENTGLQGLPVLKSKTRILSTVTNKDIRIHDVSAGGVKTTFERQRENASKLASGRSVVSKADKENEVAFKKPVKAAPKLPNKPVRIAPKLPNKPVKTLEQKKCELKKSDSLISIYQQEAVKIKEKSSEILRAPILVPGIKKASVNKGESKLKLVTNAFQIREDKEVRKEKKEEIKVKIIEEKEKKEEEEEKEKEDDDEEDEEEEEELLLRNINIIDRDEDVQNAEFSLGLYARDVFKFLRHLEECQSIRKNYLTKSHIMTQHMRTVLVDWMFDIQESFRLLNETVQLSIALLDRFMQDHPSIIKDELQLVAVACIFLASKYEEMYPPDLEDLVNISANAYTKHQILKMEQIIFSALDFQMGRPLPSQFLRRYGRAGRVDCVTYCFSKYFIDLSLVDYGLCHVRPSHLAAASLYLSLYLTSDETSAEFWTPTLVYYSKYSAEQLKPVVSKIASIVLDVPKSKFQSIRRKYLDSKRFCSVSARSELESEKLVRIANEIETCFD